MDLRQIDWEGVDWMYLAQDLEMWLSLVNTFMKLSVPQKSWNFLTV
jgi:hypothetical protein